MACCAGAARTVPQRPRTAFGECDQLLHRARRHRLCGSDDKRLTCDERYGGEVLLRIELKLAVDRGRKRKMAVAAEAHRVSVRNRILGDHRYRGDAACTASVIDYE